MSVLKASYGGNIQLLKSLKGNGVDINIKDKDGDNALINACGGTGNIDTVKWLIDQGFSPEYKNNLGYNAFHYAADKGHLSVLKFFKEINVDLKVTGPHGDNALHGACRAKSDINTIKWLLEQGFSPEQKDNNGRNAFHYAAQGGYLSVLKFFKEINVDIKVTGLQGDNALHRACGGKGDIDTIQWLLEQGFSPEQKDNNGLNAFHYTAQGGNLSVLKFFKEINVDIKATTSQGQNALHAACIGKSDIKTIKWLLEQGFSPEDSDIEGCNVFHYAAQGGSLSVLKFFKEINVDIKVTGPDGQNALHRACSGIGDINTIKWLLEQGFSPEQKDNNGLNAFHYAAQGGNLSVLKFLKEINVDTKATALYGENALHRACFGEGDIDTIKWLLEQGFSAEHKNNDGHNPFHYAAGVGNLSVLKFFKELNVDIKATSSQGDNALHGACFGKGDTNTIQWLLEQGFSPEDKDDEGRNAFHYAAGVGNLSVLKFFKEINVDIKATASQGENALHRACIGKGDIKTIHWLLEQGFSIETPTSTGRTSFHLALLKGHRQLIKFFLRLKPDLVNRTTENG